MWFSTYNIASTSAFYPPRLQKNPQNHPHFTRLKIRRSTDLHFTGGHWKTLLKRTNGAAINTVKLILWLSGPNSYPLFLCGMSTTSLPVPRTTMCRSVAKQTLLNSAHICLNTVALCQHRSPITRYAPWRNARRRICIINIQQVGCWWCATFNILSTFIYL